jgi:HSP20 family protein
MSAKPLATVRQMLPSVFDDFFKPWNEWFDSESLTKTLTVPAVNITEEKDLYKVELAAPGMNKDDFSIDVEGNMLTISASKEEEKEEKEKKYTRKEYNYASFSRSFTIPEEVNKEKIEARYNEGVLNLVLPKLAEAKKNGAQKVTVS